MFSVLLFRFTAALDLPLLPPCFAPPLYSPAHALSSATSFLLCPVSLRFNFFTLTYLASRLLPPFVPFLLPSSISPPLTSIMSSFLLLHSAQYNVYHFTCDLFTTPDLLAFMSVNRDFRLTTQAAKPPVSQIFRLSFPCSTSTQIPRIPGLDASHAVL